MRQATVEEVGVATDNHFIFYEYDGEMMYYEITSSGSNFGVITDTDETANEIFENAAAG